MDNQKSALQFCTFKTGQEILPKPASPVHDQERPAKKEATEIVEQTKPFNNGTFLLS